MRKITLFVNALMLSACYGMEDYNGTPPVALVDGRLPLDPEILRVNPKNYPVFHVTDAHIPPQPRSEYKPELVFRITMVEILPTDEWHVTHKWKDHFLITSKSYDQRQCASQEAGGPGTKCAREIWGGNYQPQHFQAIYIDQDGNISGGWKELANSSRILLPSDRKTYFNPSAQGNIGWEKIRFEKIN
jgi:hypothetical protein